jgi:hypothetical protein
MTMPAPVITSAQEKVPVIRNAPPVPKVTPSVEVPPPAVTPVVHQAPAAPAKKPDFPAPGSTSATLEQMLNVLQLAPTANERIWAAVNLVNVDWHENPQTVQALVSGARRDSTSAVRIECVRSLAKMGATTQPVMATLEALRNDSDASVRLEANLALHKLVTGPQNAPARMVK